jgi:flagellar hook-length control protein FliK
MPSEIESPRIASNQHSIDLRSRWSDHESHKFDFFEQLLRPTIVPPSATRSSADMQGAPEGDPLGREDYTDDAEDIDKDSEASPGPSLAQLPTTVAYPTESAKEPSALSANPSSPDSEDAADAARVRPGESHHDARSAAADDRDRAFTSSQVGEDRGPSFEEQNGTPVALAASSKPTEPSALVTGDSASSGDSSVSIAEVPKATEAGTETVPSLAIGSSGNREASPGDVHSWNETSRASGMPLEGAEIPAATKRSERLAKGNRKEGTSNVRALDSAASRRSSPAQQQDASPLPQRDLTSEGITPSISGGIEQPSSIHATTPSIDATRPGQETPLPPVNITTNTNPGTTSADRAPSTLASSAINLEANLGTAPAGPSSPSNDRIPKTDGHFGGRSSPLTRHQEAKLVQRVLRGMEQLQDGGGQVRLRLHPPELGSLQLTLRMEGSVMSASLDVENTVARDALLKNLPVLRERLAEQGMQIDRFDVQVDSQSLEYGSQQDTSREDSETAARREQLSSRNTERHLNRLDPQAAVSPQGLTKLWTRTHGSLDVTV